MPLPMLVSTPIRVRDKARVLEMYDQWEKVHNRQEYIDFFGGHTTVQVTPPSEFKGMQL